MVDETTFTSEQEQTFSINITDGRGHHIDSGGMTASSSDETVVKVEIMDANNGKLVSVAPGTARVILDIDADAGPDVRSVLAEMNVTVTLDPRTNERMVTVTFGTATDKAV